jgi:hypothetical protein
MHSSHCVPSNLTKQLINSPLQLLHRVELFTLEFRFEITE